MKIETKFNLGDTVKTKNQSCAPIKTTVDHIVINVNRYGLVRIGYILQGMYLSERYYEEEIYRVSDEN